MNHIMKSSKNLRNILSLGNFNYFYFINRSIINNIIINKISIAILWKVIYADIELLLYLQNIAVFLIIYAVAMIVHILRPKDCAYGTGHSDLSLVYSM